MTGSPTSAYLFKTHTGARLRDGFFPTFPIKRKMLHGIEPDVGRLPLFIERGRPRKDSG